MNDFLFQADNINYAIEGKVILENINFAIYKGEIITIIGPNGGGKSTFAKIVTGVIKNFSGNFKKKHNLKISYMPQKFNVNYNMPMSVEYFLRMSISDDCSINHFNKIANRVGVEDLLYSQIRDLSVGELQRTSLARCLLQRPDLLVLDEPEQGVDINGRLAMYKLLQELNLENSMSIMLISHDFNFVMSSTKKVICLNKHICCSGIPSDISKDKAYIDLFGNFGSSLLSLYSHHHDHQH